MLVEEETGQDVKILNIDEEEKVDINLVFIEMGKLKEKVEEMNNQEKIDKGVYQKMMIIDELEQMDKLKFLQDFI